MEKSLNLIVKKDPKSPISESYRSIRTNIKFANLDGNIKKILVTSSAAGEGKTTTTSNIACTLADDGYKVLVIDCDLRKPTLHKKFGVKNHKGLMDILLTKEDYNHYKQNIYDGLDIITSGKIPSNPSEILGSESMKNLLKSMEKDYDYIFLDTAPISAVTDPLIIAGYTEAVVLVIRTGVTPVELIRAACKKLEQANANILGTVLNGIEATKSNQHYYYYSYKYYGEE